MKATGPLPADDLQSEPPDLASVWGHEPAKHALEVAVAGGHSLLLVGPTGAGKSLLARCLPGLLPPPDPAEAQAVAEVYARAGKAPPPGRPVRIPGVGLSPFACSGAAAPARSTSRAMGFPVSRRRAGPLDAFAPPEPPD